MAKKIVNFAFCRTCKYRFKKESDEPCCDCLELAVNDDSVRPVYYKENKKKSK